MRTFEFSEGTSNKFWNITLQGDRFTVTFGRIGSAGQTQEKTFPTADAARQAHDKLVAEKLGKGYVETTPAATAPASPLRQSLEQALTESPDDLASHAAYADYLHEHGDPRGELIQVQLALEDPKRPVAEREQFRQREQALLKQHARAWMGDVGRFLAGPWSGEDRPFHYTFARGWLDTVRVLPFPGAVLASLARCPEARLLRRLEITYDMRYHPFDFDDVIEGPVKAITAEEGPIDVGSFYMADAVNLLSPLIASPHLTNLRVFKLGFTDSGEHFGYSTMVGPFNDCNAHQIIELLAKSPHLEELYLNTGLEGIDDLFAWPTLNNLRVLQYYFAFTTDWQNPAAAYPLTALANNPSLGNLHTLRLYTGRDAQITLPEVTAVLRSPNLTGLRHLQVRATQFGDGMARAVVGSGALKRLKTLDLGCGQMTDEGARVLAACPDLTNLDLLDLSRNALTRDGIAALRDTGVRLVTDDQHRPGDDEHFDVDFE